MTSILGRIFGGHADTPPPNRGDMAYAAAMDESEDVLKMLRQSAQSTDAARAVMADIWAQNRNVPFLTTVTEAVQEMKSPIAQRPDDR
jgi:hypothetical protein